MYVYMLMTTDGGTVLEDISLFQRLVSTFTPAKRKKAYSRTPAVTPAATRPIPSTTSAAMTRTPFTGCDSVKRGRTATSRSRTKRKRSFTDKVTSDVIGKDVL